MIKKRYIVGGIVLVGTLCIGGGILADNVLDAKYNNDILSLSNKGVTSKTSTYNNSELLNDYSNLKSMNEYLISEMLRSATVPVSYIDTTKNLVSKDVFIKDVKEIKVYNFTERSNKIIISASLDIDSDDFNFDSKKVVQIVCSIDNNMLLIDNIDTRNIETIQLENETEGTSTNKFYESIEDVIINKILPNANLPITYLIGSTTKVSENQTITNLSGKVIDKYKRENGNNIILAKVNMITDNNLYFENRLVDIRYCANNKKLLILEVDFSHYE